MSLTDLFSSQSSVVVISLLIFFLYALLNFCYLSLRTLPIVNGRRLFEISNAKAKQRYRTNSKELLQTGLREHNAFFLITDSGPVLVLRNKYAREVYNSSHLNVGKAVGAEMHCEIPGMDGFREDYFPAHFGPSTIRKHLGSSLDLDSVLDPLSSRISSFVNASWTKNPEWHNLPLNDTIFDMVAHCTAELRSGDELSQSLEWRRLCVDFSIGSYIAAKELDTWPWISHHVVHWFLPSWTKLRADIAKARSIFTPIVDARKAERNEAAANGKDVPFHNDMVAWLDEGSNGRLFDSTMAQLIMGQAMLLGPADLIPYIVVNLSERPQLVQELRAEIFSEVGKEGLTKATLSNLQLMDSVIKESQRMRHLFSIGMRRYAEQSITLSDGVTIPRGSLVAVAMDHMWSDSTYPNPQQFQSDRFLKLQRLSGQETAAKFSSPTIDHLGFGLGRHTCPGRFYADGLIKVFLRHILLNYDLRPLSEQKCKTTAPQAGIEIRKRPEPEIDSPSKGGSSL